MTSQAFIETPRLVLRRVTADEARALSMGQRLASTSCAEGYPTVDSADAFAPFLADSSRSGDLGPWLVIRKSDGRVIGDAGFDQRLDDETLTGGYGYAPAVWGQGYATEALTALLEQCFRDPTVRRVVADTDESNVASARVMEKAGMRLRGCERIVSVAALDLSAGQFAAILEPARAFTYLCAAPSSPCLCGFFTAAQASRSTR